MKKQLLLIMAVALLNNAFGQGIHYQKTFSQTLELAAKSGKPVFIRLVIDSKPVPGFPEIMDSQNVVSFYNKNFINYRIEAGDTAASKIKETFHADKLPAYLFLDSKGRLVYKANGEYETTDKYIQFGKTAQQHIKSNNTIGYFEELDKQGKLTTTAQFKALINLRRELGLDDDQALLDRYVANLSIKDLDDYNTVWYIFQAGPIAYGKTYNLAYTNKNLVDSIFKKEPLPARQAVNTRIITNTRNLAIKNKDARMAENSAGYARGTWGNDYKKSYNTYTNEMLLYYKAVKDTVNFYNTAGYYFDQNYYNASTDSIKKMQTRRAAELREPLKTDTLEKSANGVRKVIVGPIVIAGSPYSSIAAVLNNAAWDFYTLGTHNTSHLVKALLWSKRSIELQPLFSYYDTMAHILYRLDFKEEALLNQQKAVDIASVTAVVPTTELRTLKLELEKIKNQTL